MTRHRQSSGQTLALFAIMVPGMLAVMALGLDGAQIFLERREAQSAADLAALAGVRSLPDTPNTAKLDAKTVGAAHGFAQSQVVPVTPYDSNSSKIEVTVNSSVTTFFMPILGIFRGGDFSSVDVSARAVAEAKITVSTGGGFAIFSLESCPSLEKSVDISGSTIPITGSVHSNSDIYVSGSVVFINGETTYVDHPADDANSKVCPFVDDGSENQFIPDPPGPTNVDERADPINLTRSDFSCDYYAPSTGSWDLSQNGSWWVGGTKESKTLRPGTYCSRGSDGAIVLSDEHINIQDVVSGNGGVTFLAQTQVEISGSNFNLFPHDNGVLMFSEGDSDVALKLAGSDGQWVGALYAPNGTAEVSGSDDWTLVGGIVSERVKLNGSDFGITGTITDGTVGDQIIALVE